jgi:hypothetical protein
MVVLLCVWRCSRLLGCEPAGGGAIGHARGGVGKETGAWATFCGRGPVALGRPEVIALFFIYSKTFQIALN